MHYGVCIDCVIDNALKKLIIDKGSVQKCSICNKTELAINISTNNEFKLLVKALIRYYFSEDNYNNHWGGGSLHGLFMDENPLFNFKIPYRLDYRDYNPSVIHCFFDELLDVKGYEDDEEGISLYYGFDSDCGRGCFFTSIKDKESAFLNNIEQKLQHNNAFVISKELSNKIGDSIGKLVTEIDVDKSYYRARIGIYNHAIDLDDNYCDVSTEKYIPYQGKNLTAPKPTIASEGRLNRKGTAYLYLASDLKTSITEVKPSRGHSISVGEFRITRKLAVANFVDTSIYKFHHRNEDLEDFVLLNCIGKKLEIPNPDKNYLLTQLIADSLINLNLDGVLFNSSLTDGYNLVLFNPNDARYINCTSKAYNINNLFYDYKLLDSQINEERFYINENGQQVIGEELIDSM